MHLYDMWKLYTDESRVGQDTPNITVVWDQERQHSAPDSVKEEELTALPLAQLRPSLERKTEDRVILRCVVVK